MALNCLLLVPIWIGAGRLGPQWIALEAVAVAAALALLPGRLWARVAGAALGVAVVAVTVLALGDATARMSLARPLNLYLDMRLVPSVGHLI
ncbi:MAG: alkaline phosphatase, partial [Gemmatimonadetes bacterium]|nr:alkaline phosphatase [Gemmatimonadota bacterium]